ncbi:MAG: CAP domain-containing protein [Dehalococcoidia bacterium]
MRNGVRLPSLLAVGVALVVGAFLSLLAVGQPQVRGQTSPLGEDEAALLALINDYRLQHGLSALKVSPTLTAAARWMSEDMAEHNYLGHIDSLGRNPWQRMVAFGYTQVSLWGEVVRGGSETPEGAFEAWRNSPGHNAIMLTDGFVVAGVGRAYNPQSLYGWFWTVDFGDYDDSLAVSPTPSPTPLPTPTPTPTPSPTPGRMLGCPQPGKWAISVWDGGDETDVNDALATCGEGWIAAAYHIDPHIQDWSRWLAGRPELSDLQVLNHMQAVITLGGAGGS